MSKRGKGETGPSRHPSGPNIPSTAPGAGPLWYRRQWLQWTAGTLLLAGTTGAVVVQCSKKDEQPDDGTHTKEKEEETLEHVPTASPETMAKAMSTMPKDVASVAWQHPEGGTDAAPRAPRIGVLYWHPDINVIRDDKHWETLFNTLKALKHCAQNGVRSCAVEAHRSDRLVERNSGTLPFPTSLQEFKTLCYAESKIKPQRAPIALHSVFVRCIPELMFTGAEDPRTYTKFRTFTSSVYAPTVQKNHAFFMRFFAKGRPLQVQKFQYEGQNFIDVNGDTYRAEELLEDMRKYVDVMQRMDMWDNGRETHAMRITRDIILFGKDHWPTMSDIGVRDKHSVALVWPKGIGPFVKEDPNVPIAKAIVRFLGK